MKFSWILTYIISIIIGNIILTLVLCFFALVSSQKILLYKLLPLNIMYTIGVLVILFIVYLLSLIFKKISIFQMVERDLTFKLSKYLINRFMKIWK